MASLAARLHVATCHLAEADSTGPVAAAFNGTELKNVDFSVAELKEAKFTLES